MEWISRSSGNVRGREATTFIVSTRWTGLKFGAKVRIAFIDGRVFMSYSRIYLSRSYSERDPLFLPSVERACISKLSCFRSLSLGSVSAVWGRQRER